MTAVSCAEKSQGYPGAALHAPVHAHHQDHRARFSDPRRAAKIDSEETEETGHTGSAPRARGGSVRCFWRTATTGKGAGRAGALSVCMWRCSHSLPGGCDLQHGKVAELAVPSFESF